MPTIALCDDFFPADVLSVLTTRDKQLLSLVYLHMSYTGTVPLCLLATPSSGPTHPTRLASKVCNKKLLVHTPEFYLYTLYQEPFLIEWTSSKCVSPDDYNDVYTLFEDCLILCTSRKGTSYKASSLISAPEPSLVQSCLSLYQNLSLFVAAHGDTDEALALLEHLIASCPSASELWALYARYVLCLYNYVSVCM